MKKIVFLISIIAIFLLIINAFLLIQSQNLKREIDTLNNRIEALQKPTPTPITEIPPEGWKEYVDEEYKFKIWYPEDIKYGSEGKVFVNKSKEHSIDSYKKEFNEVSFIKSALKAMEEPIGLLYINIYNSDIDIKEFIKNDLKDKAEQLNDIKNKADAEARNRVSVSDLVEWHNQYEKILEQYANEYIDQHITQAKSHNLDLYRIKLIGELTRYYIAKGNSIFVFVDINSSEVFSGIDKITDQMVQSFRFVE